LSEGKSLSVRAAKNQQRAGITNNLLRKQSALAHIMAAKQLEVDMK